MISTGGIVGKTPFKSGITKKMFQNPFHLTFQYRKMAGKTGLEPATSTVTGWHSNQLSYFPASLFVSDSVNIQQKKFFSSLK